MSMYTLHTCLYCKQEEPQAPDAQCMRGAVWAPRGAEGGAAFVSAALERLRADAEDEELVETVSCACVCVTVCVCVCARV